MPSDFLSAEVCCMYDTRGETVKRLMLADDILPPSCTDCSTQSSEESTQPQMPINSSDEYTYAGCPDAAFWPHETLADRFGRLRYEKQHAVDDIKVMQVDLSSAIYEYYYSSCCWQLSALIL